MPYGWQPKGEYIEITPVKTKGTQIFGLMNLDNQLQAYSFQGSMDSEAIIACLNDFHTTIKKPTVVVVDNAPIHHSKKFEAKIKHWKQDDLYVFFLPTYSPHLNLIEILWRKLKYEWLPYEVIESQQALNEKLEKILRNFGENYVINFEQDNKKMANIFT